MKQKTHMSNTEAQDPHSENLSRIRVFETYCGRNLSH